ncbi:MAG TPA: hypothetical protein VMW67_02825, partial [Desulfobacteria bacterium]|nr:hypothetical protein [Desulfobacteria bacterium]
MTNEVIQKDLKGLKEFCESLKRGPAVLFLGQGYLQLDSGKDPFLSEILRKYGKPSADHSQYSLIFEGDAQNSIESALAWMQERCNRLSIPQWLKTVASFNWNGIYTSACRVQKLFRQEVSPKRMVKLTDKKIKWAVNQVIKKGESTAMSAAIYGV